MCLGTRRANGPQGAEEGSKEGGTFSNKITVLDMLLRFM